MNSLRTFVHSISLSVHHDPRIIWFQFNTIMLLIQRKPLEIGMWLKKWMRIKRYEANLPYLRDRKIIQRFSGTRIIQELGITKADNLSGNLAREVTSQTEVYRFETSEGNLTNNPPHDPIVEKSFFHPPCITKLLSHTKLTPWKTQLVGMRQFRKNRNECLRLTQGTLELLWGIGIFQSLQRFVLVRIFSPPTFPEVRPVRTRRNFRTTIPMDHRLIKWPFHMDPESHKYQYPFTKSWTDWPSSNIMLVCNNLSERFWRGSWGAGI